MRLTFFVVCPASQFLFPIDEYRPKKDIESIGETPSAKVVSKAEIEADFVEAINNKDTSIPIEPPTNTNSQEIGLKNKYFQHCVTLCVIAASFALVRTIITN